MPAVKLSRPLRPAAPCHQSLGRGAQRREPAASVAQASSVPGNQALLHQAAGPAPSVIGPGNIARALGRASKGAAPRLGRADDPDERAPAKLASPCMAGSSHPVSHVLGALEAGGDGVVLSQPGDASERQADEAAAAFAAGQPRAPAWVGADAGAAIRRKCTACEADERQSEGAADSLALGGGSPLPPDVRQPMERFFGRDFGQVSLHTQPEAAASARQLGARAFTQGARVVFGAGEFAPQTSAGQALLVHELAHVVQGGATLRRQEVGDAGAGDVAAGGTSPAETEPGVSVFDPGLVGMDGRPSLAAPMAGPTPAPPAGPDAIGWFGELLSSDGVFMAHQLRARAAAAPTLREGEEMLGRWLDEFAASIDRASYSLSDESGVTELQAGKRVWIERARRVLPVARDALLNLELEHIRFEDEFLARGELVIAGMLDMSRERVESEALRYGLRRTDRSRTRMVHDGLARSVETQVHSTYSMNSSAGSLGLATAAGVLADGAQTVVQRAQAFWDTQGLVPSGAMAEPGDTGLVMGCPNPVACEAASRQLSEARQAYDRLRDEKEREHPILAAYAVLPREDALNPLGQVVARLRGLARGPGSGNAETLFTEINEKRRNIERTGEALIERELVMWELPPALAATQGEMGVEEGSWQQRWVREAAARRSSDRSLVDMALGALALGLGLIAAIPTGGSSLVAAGAFVAGLGAAGLSSYFAVEHLRRYMLDSAASSTDFDRARAVSSADPSLFWLALDIVGAVADIHGAMSAFRALSGTVREALALRAAGPEVEAAIGAAARRAEEMHPGLGERVRQGMRREVAREGRGAETAIREWEAGMNSESRAFLVDHPETRLRYAEMSPGVRQALTFCASVCVLPSATAAQAAELDRLLAVWGEGDMTRLRQYLHASADQLDAALARLRDAPDWHAVDHAILEEARGASFAPADNPFADLTEAEIDSALDDMFSPELSGGARPRIDGHRVPTRTRRRLDIQDIRRLDGETARTALERVRRVIGVRLDEIVPVRSCWERARARVLARSSELTADNYVQLYESTRRAFWLEVLADPEAAAHFRSAGFGFPGADGSAPLLNTGADVSATEIRVSLDHIVEKAIGENWRLALDADNLRMEFAMPNTYREIIQARHPELR